MGRKRKPSGYWTKERVYEAALKCKTRNEFWMLYQRAYNLSRRNGWIDEVCSHMVKQCGIKKGESIWTKELIQKVALKYKRRCDFYRGKHKYAAEIARRNGWKDEVCSHMEKNINDKPRYIYVFIWEDVKLAYVGLTDDYERRQKEHIKYKVRKYEPIVRKTIKKYGEPIFKVLTEEPVDVNLAGEYEQKWVDNYIELGYTLVNIAKPGSLGGGNKVWDYEKVKEVAKKFKYRSDFHRNSGGASAYARKNGWLDEICSHMEVIKGQWDIFENVQKIAKQYKTRRKLYYGCRSAYEGATRNGWLDILFPKENLKPGDSRYWAIFENVKEVALKCKTRSEFDKLYRGAYKSALKNGWIDDVCSHMVSKSKPKNYWTKDRIKEAALKCKTRTEFQMLYGSAYIMAYKKGWLDEVCSHMEGNTKWDFEKVKEVALRCKTRSEFQKLYGSAYAFVRKNGWLDEVCSHMVKRK